MGLLEIVGILCMWGLAAGGGWVLWRAMPVGPSGPRAPVRWAWVLGALGVAGVGALAALIAGGSVGPALADALAGDGDPLLLASPLDGLAMHMKGTLWLLHLLVAPPVATTVACMWAPRRVGAAVFLGVALLTGFVVGGVFALPFVAGALSALPAVEGVGAPVVRAVDLLGGFVMAALVLGYGLAAASGVAVVSSTTTGAWRRCVLASAGWLAVVGVLAGALTPPDVVTFGMAVVWMSCGWGLGLMAGGGVVWWRRVRGPGAS